MQLKQLKLAGFKSFVDPTIIPFPSQLVAVVGPNGCGKSNIIDAVRWVMGESSAKNLRGESMIDVIFNGSSSRKAVGQALVELIFDNSLGRLVGQYASYQEIAVKRIVTRDGDSSYFLNGTRCRRRDITEIFLGTGAGARGYSIIGQGTISRIVESRPEELRAYLEEAAGVSKYKERRRETQLRITHTRENLVRVADICEELHKQLQRLEQQAKAAARYQVLRHEERQCQAEILALKWQSLNDESQQVQATIQQHSLILAEHQAKATHAYQQSIAVREQLHQKNEQFQNKQALFYQMTTEIARLEESLLQQQRERQRLKIDQQQLQDDWQTLSNQLCEDKANLESHHQDNQALQQQLLNLQLELDSKQQDLAQQQHQQTASQIHYEQVQLADNNATRDLQLAELQLKHSSQRQQEIQSRLEAILSEQQQLASLIDESRLTNQHALLDQLKTQIQQTEQNLETHQLATKNLVAQRVTLEKAVRLAQDQNYQLATQQAALQAKVQNLLGKNQDTANLNNQWQQKSRLAEILQVEKKWQHACEIVLHTNLQAIVIDQFEDVWPEIPYLKAMNVNFVTMSACSVDSSIYPRLSDKLRGSVPAGLPNLNKIYTAESLSEALAWLPNLKSDESVVTSDGLWLASDWLRITKLAAQDELGLFAYQEELINLQQEFTKAQLTLNELLQQRDELQQMLVEHENQGVDKHQALLLLRDDFRASTNQISLQQQTQQQATSKMRLLVDEQEDLKNKLETLAEQQLEAQQTYDLAGQTRQLQVLLLEELISTRADWQRNLAECQQRVDECRQNLHQTELQIERVQLTINQLTESLQRDQFRLQTLHERLELLAEQLQQIETPDLSNKAILDEKVGQHQDLEKQLNEQREDLQILTNELERFELLIKAEEKQAWQIQEVVQQAQLNAQALIVKANGIVEALTEFEVSLAELLASIPAEITREMREQDLMEITNKIKRLGAINLAAIDEYELESQRKNHLDTQYHDLQEALTLLESAIEKMDKETQQRLKVTFEQVNASFQILFPRLFGGGRAKLELSGDNLLEAGVIVMAQPPGKRNSTIHLLSGGEKAMTAVALVFAIFQLNPSPFCMLDEVDAPLDDANIGRFCTLVKEMSQFVQFLFISHNKMTMELADHLIGVTMREAGVSRIVAVDVESALSLNKA